MQLIAEEVEAVCVIKDVATGEMDETSLAAWIHDNSNEYDINAESSSK